MPSYIFARRHDMWRLAQFACLMFVTASSPSIAEDTPKRTDTRFENHSTIAEGIGKHTKIVLYEGLPHPQAEKELLEQELKSKKTVMLDGQPFYAETIALADDDAKAITKLVCRARSFKPYGGGKFCGGFHPDYCVQWHNGNGVYRVHLCFGCSEMKAFGPNVELYCDIRERTMQTLKDILKRYRNQRPKSRYNNLDGQLKAQQAAEPEADGPG